jgi:hypothetical protein
MAREAGCIPVRHPEYDNDVQVFATPDVLKAFEALVRADEREQSLRLAQLLSERWAIECSYQVEIEREACAQVAEKEAAEWFDNTGVANFIAAAIRARGNT